MFRKPQTETKNYVERVIKELINSGECKIIIGDQLVYTKNGNTVIDYSNLQELIYLNEITINDDKNETFNSNGQDLFNGAGNFERKLIYTSNGEAVPGISSQLELSILRGIIKIRKTKILVFSDNNEYYNVDHELRAVFNKAIDNEFFVFSSTNKHRNDNSYQSSSSNNVDSYKNQNDNNQTYLQSSSSSNSNVRNTGVQNQNSSSPNNNFSNSITSQFLDDNQNFGNGNIQQYNSYPSQAENSTSSSQTNSIDGSYNANNSQNSNNIIDYNNLFLTAATNQSLVDDSGTVKKLPKINHSRKSSINPFNNINSGNLSSQNCNLNNLQSDLDLFVRLDSMLLKIDLDLDDSYEDVLQLIGLSQNENLLVISYNMVQRLYSLEYKNNTNSYILSAHNLKKYLDQLIRECPSQISALQNCVNNPVNILTNNVDGDFSSMSNFVTNSNSRVNQPTPTRSRQSSLNNYCNLFPVTPGSSEPVNKMDNEFEQRVNCPWPISFQQ